MNMDGQKQTYEQFKTDILQWKDAHREEYRRFAKMMADGNEMQYLAVCRAIFRQLPGIKKEWQMSWCDDSTDGFENISLHFKENAVPGQIVELYRKQREEDAAPPPTTFWSRMKYIFRQSVRKRCVTLSAPLVLSWLYYGKSFESMVDMVSRQAGHPKAGNAERMGCSIVVRQIIEVSIKNGFRTQEDWDRHFAMKDAIEKGGIGEWALQSVKDKMGGGDTENNPEEAADSCNGTPPQTQRAAGKKKIQERPLADYLRCGNKEAVIQCIPPFRFHKHECRPSGTSVLCAERPAAGGRNARREGVQRGDGIAVFRLAFTEKRERHTAGGRLPEGGKACHQGRERPDGTSYRE